MSGTPARPLRDSSLAALSLIASVPACVLVLIVAASVATGTATAQTPSEHEQHHPPQTATPPVTQPSPDPAATAPNMNTMMQPMGAPPPQALYPSLIALPELTPEQRAAFERLARDRTLEGGKLLAGALERLTNAIASQDSAGIDAALRQVREGLTQLESGQATERALAAGRAPRDIAFDWFRREMNLLPMAETPHGVLGLSWFHYITMFIVTAFAIAMTTVFVQNQRRASLLVARLASGQGMVTPAALRTPGPPQASVPTLPEEGPITVAERVAPASAARAPSKQNAWTGLLRVARIFDETPTVRTFRLTDPAGGHLPFSYLPGQFLTVTVRPDGRAIKRSYTIASAPTTSDACDITVKRENEGTVSRFLHDRITEGDTLQVTAPSGKFTFVGEEAPSIVLIAGGVGITPMMSVVRYLTARAWPGEMFLIYATRSDDEVIFREELEYLKRRYPNLHLTLVSDEVHAENWEYGAGRVTRELLETAVPDIQTRRVHMCGPPPMMDAVKSILTDLAVPANQMFTEIFIAKEPQPPAIDALAAADTKVAVVTFARARQTALTPPTKTVLEAAEDVGVPIEYSCRVGTCGICKVHLLAGSVTMEVDEALDETDKANDVVLACQARATMDLVVDA